MKTLKISRVVCTALSLLFMVLAFLPAFTSDEFDWMIFVILIFVVVLLPASLVGRMKMEKFPDMLPSKGVIKFNIIYGSVLAVASAVCVVLRLVKDMSPWMYLAAVTVFIGIVVNNIIHYRIKTGSVENKN